MDGLGVKQEFQKSPGQDTVGRLSIALMESIGPIWKEGVWRHLKHRRLDVGLITFCLIYCSLSPQMSILCLETCYH